MPDTDIPKDCMETADALIDALGPTAILDVVARAIADERLREREECCKAVCAECADGDVPHEGQGIWWHSVTGGETGCLATEIRGRSQ